MEHVAFHSVKGGSQPDLYSVLARMVAAASQDHAPVRMLVYEFARNKLRQDLHRQLEAGNWSGIEERFLELEAAIKQVEADFASGSPSLSFVSNQALPSATEGQSKNTVVALRPSTRGSVLSANDGAPPYDLKPYWSMRPVPDADDLYAVESRNKRPYSKFWWNFQLAVAVLLGVIIYATIDGPKLLGFHLPDEPRNTATANAEATASPRGESTPSTARHSSAPDIPIPPEYGAYAISNGQLTQLDVLPIRVPDERVAISSIISAPSRAHLPAGQIQFVLFRRDLVNSAPDRVNVRVVAQVARALTFDPSGKASVTNVEHAWVVRSNSYQMRVAPVADNPEMILIRPDADVTLPAGRYALVLKGVAYDFTVDGPLIDPAHCLERTDALNAPVYTECRNL